MMRKRMSKRKSRKTFAKGAMRRHKRNRPRRNMRGGIRL